MTSNIFSVQVSKSVWERKTIFTSNKIRFRIRFGLQLLCVSICSAFFLYQAQQLVAIYLSGKTVVENRVERFKYSQLPAVTICLPTFLDMERLAEVKLKNSNNPDHIQLYKDFIDLKDMARVNWDKTAQDKQVQIFEKFIWEIYLNSDTSMKEMFEELAVDMTIRHKGRHQAFNEDGQIVELPLPKRVFSIAPLLDPRLCITLFSDFDSYYKDTQFSLIDLEIQFVHKLLSFPFIRFYEGDLYVSLHSSNILPEFKRENIFQKLKMGMVNFITYSESQTILLPAPYETDCKEYDKSEEQNTRSDCIEKCVDQRLTDDFGLKCTWTFENLNLVRRDNRFQSNKHLCNHQKEGRIWDIVNAQNKYRKLCEEVCPKNCFETFYSYEIETRNGDFYREGYTNFSINIDHNRFPDQVIEHKPIMDWITLVSNMGGLLGMWLGFSFSIAINKLIEIIFERYFLRKRRRINDISRRNYVV